MLREESGYRRWGGGVGDPRFWRFEPFWGGQLGTKSFPLGKHGRSESCVVRL